MKVTTLFAICFLVCLTLSVLVFNYYDTEFNKRDSPRYNPCPDFNGQDYLLTGGSKTTTTTEESQLEMLRLRWLCAGGSNE